MPLHWNWPLYNVVLLGFACGFVFTGFQSSLTIGPIALEYVRVNTEGNFTGDGYISGAIVFGTFALANWMAPSLVALLGVRFGFIVAGLGHTVYVASYIWPTTWALYSLSAIQGIAAALMWCTQGVFLVTNSTRRTIARNSGLYWAIFQASPGAVIVSLLYNGHQQLDLYRRALVFGALVACCVIGTVSALAMRHLRPEDLEEERPSGRTEDTSQSAINQSPLPTASGDAQAEPSALDNDAATTENSEESSIHLLAAREMQLLVALFAYTGLSFTLFDSVLPTALGHLDQLGDTKNVLVGLAVVAAGIGEIFVGAAMSAMSHWWPHPHGHLDISRFALFGYVAHVAAFYLLYLQVPPTAPLPQDFIGQVVPAYMNANVILCLLGCFLVGCGDGVMNTLVMSALGHIFHRDGGPAFSVFKFFQSVALAASFYYGGFFQFQYQLLILLATATVAVVCLFALEWRVTRHTGLVESAYRPIGQSN